MAKRSVPSVEDYLFPGAIFDKYRVEAELGRGGMGVVFAAMHIDLHRKVALKALLPEHVSDDTVVERFMREGRAAAKLSSEHVAKVLDVGRHAAGFPFLVMEYLEGTDLAKVLEREGPLPLGRAVPLLLQVLEGLAEAHAVGLVHRDLKPENLFVTRRKDGSPCVKVLDFGIAKELGETSAMTGTNDTFGSPHYMSPEQLRSSRGVDVRADIWAMGVVTFQLLSDRYPFDAESVFLLASAILSDAPLPLSQFRPDLPKSLDGLVARCLSKRPDDRPHNVAELAAGLAFFGTADDQRASARVALVLGVPPVPFGNERLALPTSATEAEAFDPTLQLAVGTSSNDVGSAVTASSSNAVLAPAGSELARSWTNPAANFAPTVHVPRKQRRWILAAGGGLLLVASIVTTWRVSRTAVTTTGVPGPPPSSLGAGSAAPTTLPSANGGVAAEAVPSVVIPAATAVVSATASTVPRGPSVVAPVIAKPRPSQVAAAHAVVPAVVPTASAAGHVGRYGD